MAACCVVYHSFLPNNNRNTNTFTVLTDIILHTYTNISKIKTYPFSDWVLMCVSRDLVGIQLGWHDGDEVLKHVVGWRERSKIRQRKKKPIKHKLRQKQICVWQHRHTLFRDFLCAVQWADNPRDRFSKGQVVDPVRKVISCSTIPSQISYLQHFIRHSNHNFNIQVWKSSQYGQSMRTYIKNIRVEQGFVKKIINSLSWLTRAARWAWPLGCGMDLWRGQKFLLSVSNFTIF